MHNEGNVGNMWGKLGNVGESLYLTTINTYVNIKSVEGNNPNDMQLEEFTA